MAVTKKPETFVARGKEFQSKVEAERYEDLCVKREALQYAQQHFMQSLAKSAITRDGVLFNFGVFKDYYKIVCPYAQRPYLLRVSFICWNWQVNEWHDKIGDVYIEITTQQDGRQISSRIDELYADRTKAAAALRETVRAWIAQETAALERGEA